MVQIISSSLYTSFLEFLERLYGNCLCSFGLMPASPINIPSALLPNQSTSYSLQLSTMGAVQRMDPLANLQVLTPSALILLKQSAF